MEQSKQVKAVTAFLSIDEVQRQILPMSKKNIRKFLYQYLPVKKIGNRLYVSRNALEALLNDPNQLQFPLQSTNDEMND